MLIKGHAFKSYNEETEYIKELIASGKIAPIKSSKTNGKKPAMYLGYWIYENDKDYSEYEEELRYRLSSSIDIDYYLRHPDIYERERKQVLQLSSFFERISGKEISKVSVNERSFEIWKREKFLSGRKENGVSAADVLKHCGITMEALNTYSTAEPLAYYSASKNTPQNILILENLDPFYGIRKYLMNQADAKIFGTKPGTVVYGGGKRVSRAFSDFELLAEDYMMEEGNVFLYAGDLDHEGIGIYESFAKSFEMQTGKVLLPFKNYYLKMLQKALEIGIDDLPDMKEGQLKRDSSYFFSFYDSEAVKRITEILDAGKYIPQEILTNTDYITHEI